jgi:hypothetical protein
MEMSDRLVKLDEPTLEINVYGGKVTRAKQDSLGRVYIWVKTKDIFDDGHAHERGFRRVKR